MINSVKINYSTIKLAWICYLLLILDDLKIFHHKNSKYENKSFFSVIYDSDCFGV
jgi:hypothetical protein